MKKTIIISALIVLASNAFGQVNFGIRAGYNSSLSLSNITKVSKGDYTLKSIKSDLSGGFHAGAFARLNISKIYIQPELLYNFSSRMDSIVFFDPQNKEVRFNKKQTASTVDIPVLLGYKILDMKTGNLRVFAGPKLSLNAGSKLEINNFISGDGTITQDEIIQDINKSRIGLVAGIGIDVLMFTLDARYNLINDVYHTTLNQKVIDNIPQHTFTVSLGWKFF